MFPALNADPARPSSYNFAPTDQLMRSIRAVGARALFRIGASAGENSGVPTAFSTDRDYEHYAAVVRQIVRHYTTGWDGGADYDVAYWEVLNEPDGRIPPEKYYKLYEHVAKAVKSAEPGASVGGPALMFADNGAAYREGFLEYIGRRKLPLDFWSFHDYNVDAADPLLYAELGRNTRKLLDSRGFTQTKIVLSEWNVLGIDPHLLTLGGRAAFTAAAMIYMQDSPIDDQTFYMGPNLFGEDGRTPNKVGQALIAMGRMKETPIRLAATGGDDLGFAVQAGRSVDGTRINIVVSNYEIPVPLRGKRAAGDHVNGGGFRIDLAPRRDVRYARNDGIDIRIQGLAPETVYRVERYRISDTWDYRRVVTTRVTGAAFKLRDLLPPPGIELVSIAAEK